MGHIHGLWARACINQQHLFSSGWKWKCPWNPGWLIKNVLIRGANLIKESFLNICWQKGTYCIHLWPRRGSCNPSTWPDTRQWVRGTLGTGSGSSGLTLRFVVCSWPRHGIGHLYGIGFVNTLAYSLQLWWETMLTSSGIFICTVFGDTLIYSLAVFSFDDPFEIYAL